MRLDFSTLRQPTVNMRGQVGTLGTPATTRVWVSPRTLSEVGTSGDNWGQGSIGVCSARADSCDLSPFVPGLSPAVDPEKLNVGAVSPMSPVSPSKMRRFRRHPASVQIWLAIQWARVSTPVPTYSACCREAPATGRSPLACWLTPKTSASCGLHEDRAKRSRLSPARWLPAAVRRRSSFSSKFRFCVRCLSGSCSPFCQLPLVVGLSSPV